MYTFCLQQLWLDIVFSHGRKEDRKERVRGLNTLCAAFDNTASSQDQFTRQVHSTYKIQSHRLWDNRLHQSVYSLIRNKLKAHQSVRSKVRTLLPSDS